MKCKYIIIHLSYVDLSLLFVITGRYVAPEVFKNEDYNTKVDVFSFALILQEVCFYIPFSTTKLA